MVVWAARIFDAQGGVEFVRGLPVADGGHIHRHQLGQIGWEAGRRAVPDLFIIADQQVRGLGGSQPGIVQRFERRDEAGHAGFVIQVARAHETVGHFHARVKGHEIAHLDAQLRAFRPRAGRALIQADFHVSSSRLISLTCGAVDVAGGLIEAASEPRTVSPAAVKTVTPSPSTVFQANPPIWVSFSRPLDLISLTIAPRVST